MSKAYDKALELYPIIANGGYNNNRVQQERRNAFTKGYEQAEKDLMEKFKMWVAHNGYTAQESELVYNDFKQFITEN